MEQEKFEKIMDELMSEYANSGMSMDEFIKTKLKAAGRTDAEQCAAEISKTLNTIDTKFASLQKHKTEGGNREEWLRDELDDALKDISSDKAGEFLAHVTNALNGEPDTPVENPASYSGLDAVILVRELDDALVKNTCDALSAGEEK